MIGKSTPNSHSSATLTHSHKKKSTQSKQSTGAESAPSQSSHHHKTTIISSSATITSSSTSKQYIKTPAKQPSSKHIHFPPIETATPSTTQIITGIAEVTPNSISKQEGEEATEEDEQGRILIEQSPFVSLTDTYPVRIEDEEDIDFYIPHKLGYPSHHPQQSGVKGSSSSHSTDSRVSNSVESVSANISFSEIYPEIGSPLVIPHNNNPQTNSPWRMPTSSAENSPRREDTVEKVESRSPELVPEATTIVHFGDGSVIPSADDGNDPSEDLWKVVDGEIDEQYSNDEQAESEEGAKIAIDEAEAKESEVIGKDGVVMTDGPSNQTPQRRGSGTRSSFSLPSPDKNGIVNTQTHGHAQIPTNELRHQLLEHKGYSNMAEHAVEKVLEQLIEQCSELLLFDIQLISNRIIQQLLSLSSGAYGSKDFHDEAASSSSFLVRILIGLVHGCVSLLQGLGKIITSLLWIGLRFYLWWMFLPLRITETCLYWSYQIVIGGTVLLLSYISTVNDDVKKQPLPEALKSQIVISSSI